jgi:ComF family protein
MPGQPLSERPRRRRPESRLLRGVHSFLGETGNIVRLTLFSPRCKLCQQELVHRWEIAVCSACRTKIRICELTRCRICGKFIEDSNAICGSCSVRPPPFIHHASYAPYEGALKELIILYKFGEILPLRNLLADCYLDLFDRLYTGSFDFIVPVPSNRNRGREFAPVHEIARILSRRLGISMLGDMLIKIRNTPPQVGLTLPQRIRNLNGAFRLKGGERGRGRNILLVDDVYTTGTTIRKCAETLKRGKANVQAITLAQSLRS